jgi:alkylhydroperoxidase/carboxymuconolactone decarboxylase family protein YurZ
MQCATAGVAEIREIFLHAAIYSGFPKAVAAFRAAREVLDEPGTKKLAEENACKAPK